MSDYRERLRARSRPFVEYLLPVGDVAAAKDALAEAESAHRVTLLRGDEGAAEAVEAARLAVTQAKEALDACYEKIKLTAMPPADFEALAALHPPRPATEDEPSPDITYNIETFPLACFLACASPDLAPDEWEAFIADNVSLAERGDLLSVAVAVNVRFVNAAVPKDSTPTVS